MATKSTKKPAKKAAKKSEMAIGIVTTTHVDEYGDEVMSDVDGVYVDTFDALTEVAEQLRTIRPTLYTEGDETFYVDVKKISECGNAAQLLAKYEALAAADEDEDEE